MEKIFLRVILLISTGWIVGCTTVSGPVHAYDGHEKDRRDLAKLVATTIPGSMWKAEEQSLFCGVDGIEFEQHAREIYLLPGRHVLCVRYSVPSSGFLIDATTKRFNESLSVYVSAGKRYDLLMETEMSGIVLSDVHFWLEDMASNVVATTKNIDGGQEGVDRAKRDCN